MRRLASFSPQVGSSPIESLLLGALVFLVAAAIVGMTLVLFLGPRAAPGNAASSGPTAPSATTVPAIEIACGVDGTSVEGEAVDATSGGVPVQIVGDEGAVLSFASPGMPGHQMRVFEPSGSYRLPLAPGGWGVGCAGSGVVSESVALGVFEVRDPDHVYLRTAPECPASGCCDEIVDLPAGFIDDDLGTLREGLADAGVRPTDTIERAAYPGSTFSAQPPSPLVYRVVRDLQIVARLDVGGEGDTWSARVYGCPAD
ncbi:MAG: hypothetical protein ACXWF5_10400 [Actinomycetota bacterium]